MSKEEKILNDNNSVNKLSLDELDEVAGGRISLAGYALLFAAIEQFKALGKDKEYVIQAVTKGWNEGCDFVKFTDGSDMDLQRAIRFINRVW